MSHQLSPISPVVSDNLKLVSDAATVRDVAIAFGSVEAKQLSAPRPTWSAVPRPRRPIPPIPLRPVAQGVPIFTAMKVGQRKRIVYRGDLIFFIATHIPSWEGKWDARRESPEGWIVERTA